MSQKNLKTHIGETKLRNPTLLAAGVLGLTGATLKKVWKSGAGGLVTKSVGKKPKKGYPGPNVVETPCGMINAMGLPNPGIENEIREIEIAKEEDATVIGSIFGEKAKEFKKLAKEMDKAQVEAIELNLSCPHAEKVSAIGQDPNLTRKVIEKVKESTESPIWAKLPGNTHLDHLLKVAKTAENAGVDALVVTNTIPAMSIDIKSKRPVLGNEKGGLSGPAIKPIGIRLVYEVYEETEIPIIGTGGVTNGEDLLEYIIAGASAVEIGTGITWRDIEIFEKICGEVQTHLDEKNVEDLVGSAHNS